MPGVFGVRGHAGGRWKVRNRYSVGLAGEMPITAADVDLVVGVVVTEVGNDGVGPVDGPRPGWDGGRDYIEGFGITDMFYDDGIRTPVTGPVRSRLEELIYGSERLRERVIEFLEEKADDYGRGADGG